MAELSAFRTSPSTSHEYTLESRALKVDPAKARTRFRLLWGQKTLATLCPREPLRIPRRERCVPMATTGRATVHRASRSTPPTTTCGPVNQFFGMLHAMLRGYCCAEMPEVRTGDLCRDSTQMSESVYKSSSPGRKTAYSEVILW